VRRLGAALLIFLPSLCIAAPETEPVSSRGDAVLAHDLFDQGRALMETKRYAAACQKFEESRRLDPGGGGGGTMLNLALCQELSGKTGTAWAYFRTALSLAIRDRRPDRQAFAQQHIESLTPRLLRLRVLVPPEARVPGLLVLRGGIALGEAEWSEALVVDPGEQIVEARAPGRTPFRRSIRLDGDGTSLEMTIPLLPPAPRENHAAEEKARRDPDIRVAGILVGGVGLATIAMGSAFGVRAVTRHNEADELCPTYDHCNPIGISLSADAASDGRASTALIIGGAVLLATGTVLFLTAPLRKRDHGPALQGNGGGLPSSVVFAF